MQSNRTALAKETFDLVLQLDPNNTMTLQNYGKDGGSGLDHVTLSWQPGLLCIHEEPSKALDLMSQLLVLQPDNKPVQRQVQLLHRAVRKG